MGEAKRRRAATGKIVEKPAEEPPYRIAGMSYSQAHDRFRKLFTDIGTTIVEGGDLRLWAGSDVPCHGCKACCYQKDIEVAPSEPQEWRDHLDLVETNGKLSLRRRDDGACVHLGDNGCTVYEHRPLACRAYDCRMFSLYNVQTASYSGQQEPAWTFSVSTQQDRLLKTATDYLSETYGLIYGIENGSPGEAVNYIAERLDETVEMVRDELAKRQAEKNNETS